MGKENHFDKKSVLVLVALIIIFVAITILQDSLYSKFYNTSFYFSESFLFTSFWWIFIPLLYTQYIFSKRINVKSLAFAGLIIFPILLHLIAFPCLVWLLSRLFFDHTFRIAQTLNYSLSAHLYLLISFYALPILCFKFFRQRFGKDLSEPRIEKESFKTSFLVTEGNKKMNVEVSAIQYFSANTPYVTLHVGNKKYLYNDTLKAIAGQLSDDFVRIHKSTIVNIKEVKSYTSRLNGDYDLSLLDGTELRISRNFIGDFKNKFQKDNRVATA